MNHTLVWLIAGAAILLILIRPKKIPEAVWASAAAMLLVALRLISPANAFRAVSRGLDVYLFLAGMMVFAELARREGFFDWIAVIAVQKARRSPKRLFAIVYVVGAIVTVFLSNDATAVVLTPAVLTALEKARAKPLPYLLICAFIANAASFVLPISNPANLVVYGSKMPPLGTWLTSFALPSLVSIVSTFVILRFLCRKDLEGTIESNLAETPLSPAGKRAAFGIAGAAMVLILASAFDLDLGLPTFLTALAAAGLVAFKDHGVPRIAKDISWSVLVLVAGLFMLVAAVEPAGALGWSESALSTAHSFGPLKGSVASGFGVALLSNVANNLPVGLLTGAAVHAKGASHVIKNALLIGVDLGPNLSVTGSLATILWLVALRRDGEDVSAWKFLRFGILLMPSALVLSLLASLLTSGVW